MRKLLNRRSLVKAGIGASAAILNLQSRAESRETSPDAAEPQPPFFPTDVQFCYETLRAFGAASYGGSEFGEVFTTVSAIRASDYDSWYEQWNRTAARLEEEGLEQLRHGHRVRARDTLLRATTYYRSSDFFLRGNPLHPRIEHAYTKSIACYRACAALFDPPIESVEIPYEHTTLPGYFHRSTLSEGLRPTIIMHSGFDGSAEEMHLDGARAAVERGYHVLAFDGPGQYGPIHREGLTCRPDWEHVVGPVLDFTQKIPGVNLDKIALMGVSFGDELGPRAAAFERRIAALIANDGIYFVGAANLATFPPDHRATIVPLLSARQAPQLDAALAASMRSSPTVRWALTQGMYVMGAPNTHSYLAKAMATTYAMVLLKRFAVLPLSAAPTATPFPRTAERTLRPPHLRQDNASLSHRQRRRGPLSDRRTPHGVWPHLRMVRRNHALAQQSATTFSGPCANRPIAGN